MLQKVFTFATEKLKDKKLLWRNAFLIACNAFIAAIATVSSNCYADVVTVS
ncbi:MAG: hypothetical protein LBH84_07945 [Prevotellaceae bacterium]|jgi:hypothetical protein|nr:hypothetical protein [Prevotellaceae bacterium]